MQLLPNRAVRVLVTAGLHIIKERFAKRMNGNLSAPVALMLEKRHGSFDNEQCDLRVDNTVNVFDTCAEIIRLCGRQT